METKLTENVYWVGIIDWNIRDFHGYTTRRGTSYNSYLILDEKTVLVDTVKSTFSDEFFERVEEIVNFEKINYIIVNHVEMDHSSSLLEVLKKAKNAVIVTSANGKSCLIKHYGEKFTFKIVKTGDELKLGKKTLRFIEAPMLHWPDNMLTYLIEDNILMSNDAFGQHLASSKHFDDEIDENILMEEAAKYYANILMLYSPLIKRKITELTEMKIPIKMIAPSHGIIWRLNPKKIINAYSDWSNGVFKKKAIIVYDTMWKSTGKMAKSIAEGISNKGVEVKIFKLRATHNSDIIHESLDAKAIVIGSPTLNNSMFPSVSSFLTYIMGLNPKGKIWSFFGSYGWGGGAVRQMKNIVSKAGFEVNEKSLQFSYIPTKEELKECFIFGEEIANKILETKA